MKLLLVEDEHKIAASLKKGLEQESYTIDVVYDGTAGLDLGLSEDYDLIILDRLLPEIDGVEICKKLRAQGNHTPVLMLTAKGQLQDRLEGFDAGADDYVVKPFAFEELLARIKALVRRPKKSISTVYSCEDLTLDSDSFEVKRSGNIIHLSSKEFALLEYLLRHQKKTLSKEQIISHVWNYDSDILPNTVEVYMGYLRNKIDKAFPHKTPLIHTIRGFGYRIGA